MKPANKFAIIMWSLVGVFVIMAGVFYDMPEHKHLGMSFEILSFLSLSIAIFGS